VLLYGTQALNKVISIRIGPKYFPPFNTAANDVLQRSGGIYASFAGHKNSSNINFAILKVIFS
jgi:hypothetical protein